MYILRCMAYVTYVTYVSLHLCRVITHKATGGHLAPGVSHPRVRFPVACRRRPQLSTRRSRTSRAAASSVWSSAWSNGATNCRASSLDRLTVANFWRRISREISRETNWLRIQVPNLKRICGVSLLHNMIRTVCWIFELSTCFFVDLDGHGFPVGSARWPSCTESSGTRCRARRSDCDKAAACSTDEKAQGCFHFSNGIQEFRDVYPLN